MCCVQVNFKVTGDLTGTRRAPRGGGTWGGVFFARGPGEEMRSEE